MTTEIPSGSQFPDLDKANLNKKLGDLIQGLMNDDKEFFQLAQDKKEQLRKQRAIDLKSFIISQGAAVERGNSNACDNKHKVDQIAAKQAAQVKPVVMPGTNKKSPLIKGKNKTELPKTRSSTPTRGERSRPPSIAKFKLNQGTAPALSTRSHYVQPIDANNNTVKAKRNADSFARAQAGNRGTSIGDRAVVFSANGTPHYGDSYLDKIVQENLSANQATSNAPISQIPSKVEVGKPISPNPLQQQPRANVSPKSDTTANILVLGGIGAAVTAVLFFFQYVIMFVGFMLQVSSVTSTITNVAGSFVAILNNIGSFFGLGENLLEPLSKTFDGILNNTFGKDKVDYARYQFAKISSAFVAGQNLVNKVSGLNNTIGKVTEDNANNTSKIGNALKAIGMMASGEGWMREDNKVAGGVGKVGAKLESVGGFASSLSEIISDVKSAKEQQASLDKEQTEKEKTAKEGESKATEKHADSVIPDLEIIQGATK
jgi:hypothetical protein